MGDLFDDDDEGEGAPSPFADAGELAPRRKAIGRPQGSRNKHSEAFETYYYAQGYRDPLVAAAQLVTVDPVALFAWFREHNPSDQDLTLRDVVKLQLEAGRDIAPYLHGKAPVRIIHEGERLPYLVINAATNQLAEAAKLVNGKALSIGTPDTNENNDLAPEASDRLTGDRLTGGEK